MNVDGTKVLCQVNGQGIRESLGLSKSFTRDVESFN